MDDPSGITLFPGPRVSPRDPNNTCLMSTASVWSFGKRGPFGTWKTVMRHMATSAKQSVGRTAFPYPIICVRTESLEASVEFGSLIEAGGTA